MKKRLPYRQIIHYACGQYLSFPVILDTFRLLLINDMYFIGSKVFYVVKMHKVLCFCGKDINITYFCGMENDLAT